MDALENLLGQLPNRMSGTGKQSHIFTPANIAKEMINILPEEVWNPDTKFLDICCKSGIFLYEIYKRLMDTDSLIKAYPDKKARREYILNNQLFGIAPDTMCQMMATRTTYGYLVPNSHIIDFGTNYNAVMQNTDKRFLYDTLRKEFNRVNFDVVIGNPPYNKGMDLDFVDLAYNVAKEDTGKVCMITPAKWQTTADDYSGCASKNIDYKQVREKYVPHMSHVCYYPDALDIFHISQVDGLTYFLMDKDVHNTATIKNISLHQKYYNSETSRDIKNRQTLINIGQDIVDSLGSYKIFKIEETCKDKQYKVVTNSQIVLCGAGSDARKAVDAVGRLSNMFNSEGQSTFIGTPKILNNIPDGAYGCVFSSDNKEECESFVSWLNTRFTRFFVAINISKLTGILTNDCFRFVPAPPSSKFDHIYTDDELYKAFSLSQKYIDVIESIIKERK